MAAHAVARAKPVATGSALLGFEVVLRAIPGYLFDCYSELNAVQEIS